MDTDKKQLAEWREEQHRIASQVVVPKSTIPSATADRFQYYAPSPTKFINPNNKTKNSENTLLIGGVDVSFPAHESQESIAVYVILEFTFNNNNHDNDRNLPPKCKVVHRSHKFYKPFVPYIPSYLAFREIDPLCELITSQMQSKPQFTPDVIMVDGNGSWHERKAGIACFVGVRTGIPTIGVGKTFYSVDGCLTKEKVLDSIHSSLKSWCEHATAITTVDDHGGRGLYVDCNPITCKPQIDASSKNDSGLIGKTSMQEMLQHLHNRSYGLAIPMQDPSGETTLAYALIGHGGNDDRNQSKRAHNGNCSGTKTPIYISVGNKLSPEDAVALCAIVSYVRIPEPVREADLYGRQLLRDREEGASRMELG